MKIATNLLVFLVFSLVAFSIFMLVSASTGAPHARYLTQQPIWCVLGVIGCGLVAWIDYRQLRRWSWLPWAILGLAVGLLLLVLVIGRTVNGATRWLDVAGLRFQPSEFAKLALLIALAHYAEHYQRQMPKFWRGMVMPLGLVAVVAGLVFCEPDVGTALLISAVASVVLLIAGLRLMYFLPPFVAGLIAVSFFIAYNPTRSDRVYSWLHLEETKLDTGLQVWTARVAMGSGGMVGRGPAEGRSKLGYLPEHHTDFILALIGEELGFAATATLMMIYLCILVCGVFIAWHAPDVFGLLLATGITFLIGLQAFINIGVVTGALPNKGLALPFISYGGSSLVALLLGVGLLISIGRRASQSAHSSLNLFGGQNPFAAQPAAETI